MIKMKYPNIELSMYIAYDVEHNDKDPKFKVGDHARKSKYKSIFAKGYTPKWSHKDFVIM